MSAPLVTVEPSMSLIIDVVSEIMGVSAREIVSHRRHRPAARARKVVYWVAPRVTSGTWHSISSAIGGRHATTAAQGDRTADAAFAGDPDLQAAAYQALDVLNRLTSIDLQRKPEVDALRVAASIAGSGRPEREAIGASTREVVAMACRLVALDAIAEAAATLIGARDAGPAGPKADTTMTPAEEEAAAALAEGLTLLGYVTMQEEDNGQ